MSKNMDGQMSLWVEARVPASQSQGSEKASTESPDSYSSISELLKRLRRDISCSRMFQAYSVRETMPSDNSYMRWLNSGIAISPTEFMMLNSSTWPSDAAVCSLSGILQSQDSVPQKYYLSETAAQGILRRTAKRGKPLPPLLEKALRKQAGMED